MEAVFSGLGDVEGGVEREAVFTECGFLYRGNVNVTWNRRGCWI